MNSPPEISRLLSLPYEIRMQIWRHAIPIKTDLLFCPCLDHPPRDSPTASCLCRQDSALAIHQRGPLGDIHHATASSDTSSDTPRFILDAKTLLSSLPLTCRLVHAETYTIPQPRKTVTLCSARCLLALLSALSPAQLAYISRITVSIDLRVFRPPPSSGQRASFHDIWRCIYNTRLASEQTIRKFYASPSVERMNPDPIVPALDFYPLLITTGRPFDRREIAHRRFWSDPSKAEERVAELRRIVGNRSREGLPTPRSWRAHSVMGGVVEGNASG